MEPGDDIGDVVFRHGGPLIIQGEAVRPHIVEPHLVRSAVAGFGEDEYPGGHPGVGLEHPRGHGDNRLQTVVVHQLPADIPVGLGGPEQHAVRNDTGAPPAHLEHFQKQGQKQQFSLLGFAQLQQVGGHDIRVQAALEGGIGQDEGVLFTVRVLDRKSVV